MDLGLSRDVEESFRIFQGRILDEYDAMAEEVGFHIIDATESIEAQQMRMREIVMNDIGGDLTKSVLRVPVAGEFIAQTSTSPVL
jgi:dTMP kinase